MTLVVDILSPVAAARSASPAARGVAAEAVDVDTTCAHCHRPVPAGLVRADVAEQFCCAGCEAVFQTLQACGLAAYYRLRDATQPGAAEPATVHEDGLEAFDSPTFAEAHVRRHENGMATADLALDGVSCAACVWLVEKLPQVVPGVVEARLSLREATVRLTWDPTQVPLSRVARALARLGYRPYPARAASAAERHRRETRRRLVHLGAAGALMGNTMLLGLAMYAGDAGHMEGQYRTLFRWLSAGLGGLSLAWPGATFFRSALAAVRLRAVNLDVPIALALLVGGAAGLVNVLLGRGEIYFDSLSVLVFLLLVGRFVQYRQQRHADDAVGLLFNLTPSTCHLVQPDGTTADVPVEALRAGDAVEVRPGELFPADGVVAAGRSSASQALLTGESAPVAVDPGAAVHAGTQNVGSPLTVRVERVGRDTRVGRLMGLIEQGVRDKPPIVEFADRVAAWFVVVVSVVAAATLAFWTWRTGLAAGIDRAVALLIVTCPCVLGLATPMTIAIAVGKLARQDILVKSGAALERLAHGGRLLLDKTGTLTEGRLALTRWAGTDAWAGLDLRRLVAALERKSNHPVGRALADALAGPAGAARAAAGAPTDGVTDIVERGDGGIAGRVGGHVLSVGSPRYAAAAGVAVPPALAATLAEIEAAGSTAVVVAVDAQALAVAGLGDQVRADAGDAVARLRALGWRPAILSGDAQPVVARVAGQVGVAADAAVGGLSPEQKLERVRGGEGNPRTGWDRATTVMVGDGVNDAAALAAAEVGVAVRGGAEASLAAADVYLARPGLQPLCELAQTSRRVVRVIRRNLAVSLAYNLLAGTLAAAGVMSPLIAAIIMPVSSATVLSLVVLSVGRARGSKDGASWK